MKKKNSSIIITQSSTEGNSSPDDIFVVVVRHRTRPHHKPIQTKVIRRWAIPAVKEAWSMFLEHLPVSKRGDFSISFDERHIQGGKR